MKFKIIIILTFISFFFTSCDQVDGISMAKEVCDCTKKANDIPKSNGSRFNEFSKCWDLMDVYIEELEDFPEELKKFDDYFPCIDTLKI